MSAQRVIYAIHKTDEVAAYTMALLYTRLAELLGDDMNMLFDEHLWVASVQDGPEYVITGDEVVVITYTGMDFPNPYLRIITLTDANRAEYQNYIPRWAQHAKRFVFVNPTADTERHDATSGKNCFQTALLRMHGEQGGFTPPPKPRPIFVRRPRGRRSSYFVD